MDTDLTIFIRIQIELRVINLEINTMHSKADMWVYGLWEI